MNLFEAFRSESRWDPEKVFLRELGSGSSRIFTYGDLENESSRWARYLIAQGLKPGDRIAAQLEKSPEALFLYLGCLRAGGVFLPLNPAFRQAEIDAFRTDAEPSLLIREAELKTAILPAYAEFKSVPREPGDPAALLYTSGTTGRSKGAVLTHQNLASNARALTRAWGFTSYDRLLHALPIFHVHGLFISLHCALMSGSEVLWLERFEAEAVVRELHQCTVFMGVPTYYTRLLEQPGLEQSRCRGVRLFVSGSAPLSPETWARFAERTGHELLERYGMTETGVIATNPLDGERVAGAVGYPVSETDLRLGAGGEIEVRGPGVFHGYWRRERAASDFTADGYFKTGDLGEWDPSGSLRIVGRAKDLIITGGFNVYPKEIELVLDGLPEVAESSVFGVSHPDFGEAVVAAVVTAGESPFDESQLIAMLRERVAPYKAPKRILFLETLPRNAMGKVQKNQLRERYSSLFDVSSTPP